jgi:hypothetical protein
VTVIAATGGGGFDTAAWVLGVLVMAGALCVFASILLHGLTDTPGSEWVAKRAEQPAPEP